MSQVLVVNKNTKSKILKTYNKTDEDLIKDVEIIKNWLQTQPHLPEIPSTKMIEFFLISNKFSIELTKEKLDTYYSIRSLLPNLFSLINPKHERIKAHVKTSYIFPLPKLVDDVYRIFFIKELELPLNVLYAEGFLAKLINAQEIRLHEDIALGNILLVDCTHLNIRHSLALTPVHAKMGTTVLEKVYSNRLKEMHFFNHSPIISVFLKLMKAVMKPKLVDRIKLHDSLDSLKQHIPAEVLPKEYGGDLPSIHELQELWQAKYKEYEDRFDKLDSMKVNEALRPTPMKDVESYGIQGTFKKLSID